jgi:hypothetical protein
MLPTWAYLLQALESVPELDSRCITVDVTSNGSATLTASAAASDSAQRQTEREERIANANLNGLPVRGTQGRGRDRPDR